MRPTTRLLILDYLRKQQTATVFELSRSMGMTGANVRHHLQVLESNGLIELIGQRREGRGRPENIYGLSRRVLGDGLAELAGAMLSVWLKNAPENASEAALASLAQRLAGGDTTALKEHLSLRLARMVDKLNELHYQARWEAGAEGPHIILGHCPYSAIIDEFPELCRMDALLLAQFTGLSVTQTAKLHPNAKGAPYCTFVVSENRHA